MAQYTDFKEGTYVKCVFPRKGENLTLGKIYKIESMWNKNSCTEFSEFVNATMKDDKGYPFVQPIYHRQYKMEKKVILKWYYLFIPKIEYVKGDIYKEKIYFEKATELEIAVQNYNL